MWHFDILIFLKNALKPFQDLTFPLFSERFFFQHEDHN
jgi:hypothetical protein